MDIPRKTREQFKALSKEIFGISSKWRRILENGTRELVTRTTIEIVPGENGAPDTEKEIKIPVLVANGAKLHTQKYYTPETLMALLLEMKARRDEFMAMAAKQKEEERIKKEAEETAKKVQEELGGSAL